MKFVSYIIICCMLCSCASGIKVIRPTKIGDHKNYKTPTSLSSELEGTSSEKKTR